MLTAPIDPTSEQSSGRKWMAEVSNVNDLDEGSYWMGPPWTNKVDVMIDLGKIYDVYDIFVWFVLLSQGFAVWV